MAKRTTRDEIWNVAIKTTLRGGNPIKPSDVVDIVGVSDHTARDALNTMEKFEILKRDLLEDDTVRYLAHPEFKKTVLSQLIDEEVVVASADLE